MDDAVRELARDAGIAVNWIDAANQPQQVTAQALRTILCALGFPCTTRAQIEESRARLHTLRKGERPLVTAEVGAIIPLPGTTARSTPAELQLESGETQSITLAALDGMLAAPAINVLGYHRLRFAGHEITLAVAPTRCVTIEDLAPGRKLYGLAVQLYSLRRAGDGGIGDTAALTEFVHRAAREGADAIALSPTHSLFAADPAHYGPYSPSSRLFFNPVYADPAIVLGRDRAAAAQACRAGVREDASLIDWPQAGRDKLALLRALFDDFAAHDLTDPASRGAAAYRAFEQEGGERLREHALFEALHAHWLAADAPQWDWRTWPSDWRTRDAPQVVRFAREHARAIESHVFAQWLAARSFAAAQDAAREAGMRIGLIADLAVGMSPAGSHAWSRHQDVLLGLSVGAPPDLFNPRGQNWGLTAFSPQALIARGFEPFIATLRAALRAAGGARIDHAMGLSRLWLIPDGASASAGAYLHYPLEDMLRLIALESHRHHAIVIGEDLGTVQPEFRARIEACGIAGMDVLWFCRDRKGFLPPSRWRRDAVAMTTTHDLPTVAGWWTGADIETRAALGLAEQKRDSAERKRDRAALWRAFRKAKAASGAEPAADDAAPAVDAAIAFTGQAPSRLALIPLEDVLGLAEQPNLPGTIDEHPNWRRRLPHPAREVLDAPQARARLKTLRERR